MSPSGEDKKTEEEIKSGIHSQKVRRSNRDEATHKPLSPSDPTSPIRSLLMKKSC